MTELLQRFTGTWLNDPENPSVEWRIALVGDKLNVVGVDVDDGERYAVTEISFADETLRWRAEMPSTQYVTEHQLTLREDGNAEHRCTLSETLMRRR